MKPRERRETGSQDSFHSRLDQIINMNHELVKLAKTISWSFIETRCGEVYAEGPGMPPRPTWLMAGLTILKLRNSSSKRADNVGTSLLGLFLGCVFGLPPAHLIPVAHGKESSMAHTTELASSIRTPVIASGVVRTSRRHLHAEISAKHCRDPDKPSALRWRLQAFRGNCHCQGPGRPDCTADMSFGGSSSPLSDRQSMQ